MCLYLIKVFIVIWKIGTGYQLNIHMPILSNLSESRQHTIKRFFAENNLINVYELDLPFALKQSENFQKADIEQLWQYCNSANIDPATVVISETSLSPLNSPFIHVHLPVSFINHNYIKEVADQQPTKHFNFLAGNYHYDRYLLLNGLYRQDLLKNTHWSAYRNVNTEIHRQHHYTNDFLDFCESEIPRTMKHLQVHNDYPENVLDSNLYVDGSFIKDSNNVDQEIFIDSAITITVDTFASTIPSVYKSKWSDVDEKIGNTMYYTAKIIKPIKHKRPFISLIGKGKHADKYLKEMGFKTFDSIWSESYFEADTPKKRVDQVVELCYNLSKENVGDIYRRTRDICNENYDTLTKTDWIKWYLNQIKKNLVTKPAIT